MSYLEHLALSLNSSVASLISGYLKAPQKYKVFKIRKKNNKSFREIAQPSPDIKNIQRAITSTLLKNIPIHPCAKAYIEGLSIYNNAYEHRENNYLLKMDFKNFFPSITPNDLLLCFKRNNIELNNFEYNILKHYLFWRKRGERSLRLCIGAPSSPTISNIVMYEFDCKIHEYCITHNIPYTRYADDLTFSSNEIEKLHAIYDYVTSVILENKSPNITINDSKTRYIGKGRSRRVTGVIITNEGKLGVGRYLRKKVKALLYIYNNKDLRKEDIPYLQGMLAHIKNIEPSYYEKLLQKYEPSLLSRLGKEAATIIKERSLN
ncbi:retron St85 family RNA-directed DNA polymerase [Pectobacterium brasiliense]|uniref:retron St85 family RNA-directed DNA polymerase n=1 Tax=Pectobacterium brasiliense TaxID=180957 RepID=UPI0019D33D42|nr:retron St85 family RNA-directed DNA polymerase [Pectobacterium brasiliense]MBN7767330.1 retron St85 family RNA-directed DNA polymerase [Pectobacterium brasiliense]